MAKKIKAFDDSLQKDRRKPTSNPSSNMSEYAAHRQGVELTQGKDYAAGIAKIHSGYNEQDGNHEGPAYVESGGILGQSRDLSSMESHQEDVASSDGAIEPFEIRRVVSGHTHLTQVKHKQAAYLDEGNISETGGVDSFVTIVKFVDSTAGATPFEDEASTMGGLRISTEEKSSDRRVAGSFDDQNDVKGTMITEDSMPSDIVAALRAMTPSTVNIISAGQVQVGAHGFDDYVVKIGPTTSYQFNTSSSIPLITSLSHRFVFDEGGETLTIHGDNFQVGAIITIAGITASNTTFVNENQLTCDVPAYPGLAGGVSVIVRNPDGKQASARLTYVANDMMNGFRLGLFTGNSTSGGSSSTLYLTPYYHGRIALYNGSIWVLRTSTEVSLVLSGLTLGKNYDVFAYDNMGTVTLELSTAWTSDTLRADSLARVSGVLVKSSNNTRRYIGTFRSTSTTATTSTTSQRFVFNQYNRLEREMSIVDTNTNWSYVNPNSVWRQVRATATNCFEYVTGDADSSLFVRAQGQATASVNTATNYAAVGIGIDATTSNSAITYGGNPNSTTLFMTLVAEYRGSPGLGYHKINWLETGVGGAVTYTFVGRNGTTVMQTGMIGSIAC